MRAFHLQVLITTSGCAANSIARNSINRSNPDATLIQNDHNGHQPPSATLFIIFLTVRK